MEQLTLEKFKIGQKVTFKMLAQSAISGNLPIGLVIERREENYNYNIHGCFYRHKYTYRDGAFFHEIYNIDGKYQTCNWRHFELPETGKTEYTIIKI